VLTLAVPAACTAPGVNTPTTVKDTASPALTPAPVITTLSLSSPLLVDVHDPVPVAPDGDVNTTVTDPLTGEVARVHPALCATATSNVPPTATAPVTVNPTVTVVARAGVVCVAVNPLPLLVTAPPEIAPATTSVVPSMVAPFAPSTVRKVAVDATVTSAGATSPVTSKDSVTPAAAPDVSNTVNTSVAAVHVTLIASTPFTPSDPSAVYPTASSVRSTCP
jgi:hypothetical protein